MNINVELKVRRIESLLRSAGVMEDLLYKPDIFSTLGIYRNNIWGFRPTIYSSKAGEGIMLNLTETEPGRILL